MTDNPLYCEKCGAFVDTKIQKKCETLRVKGINITLNVDTCICSLCGEAVFSPEVDEASLERFYREYRKRMGLLQPEEIRAIRTLYGMSQETFARVLGMGAKTIARYENGSIQDEAQNNLIFLVKEKKNMRKLMELHPERFTSDERSALTSQMDYTASVSSAEVSTNIIDITKYLNQKGDSAQYADAIFESSIDLLSI